MSAAAAADAFRVAITGDFRDGEGGFRFNVKALAGLQHRDDLAVALLDSPVGGPLPAEVLGAFDAIIMKRTPLPAGQLARRDLRLIHIARNGVGTEHLDLEECSRAGILVTTTPDSVRRPMASGAMALMLNFAQGVNWKAAALRTSGWAGRFEHTGTGLTGRTLGLIGCGNIGREILRLAAPWEMERIVSAPGRTDREIAALGAIRVGLEELLGRSDFVILCCPLTPSTAQMIDAAALARMRPESVLINIGRGGLVDEAALIEALAGGRLAGAGLDVFDPEPPAPDNPLLTMSNVIVTAHNIGLTEEGMRLGNAAVAEAVALVAAGRHPRNIANPAALEHPRIAERLGAVEPERF